MRSSEEPAGLVLIVEDNRNISEMVGEYLEGRGFEVDYASDGLDGYRLAAENSYDVIVLDLMLPRLDGLEVCKRLREEARKSTPVLMLTARDTLDEKLTGLGAGADDYLTKPFALQELLARLRALLRRVVPQDDAADETLTFADLSMDVATREVRRGGRAIELTRTEFTLLEMFLRRPRRVLERSFILEEVWGYDFPTTANSLEVYVGYLRRKTESEGEPRLIHTVRGVGYVLRASPE